MKHTPTPWRVEGKDDHWNLMKENNCMIAVLAGKRPAIIEDKFNVEYIVRAVNSHDELVEACKNALGSATMMITKTNGQMQLAWMRESKRLEKALAKASAL